MNRWTDGQIYRWIDGKIVDRQIERWIDGKIARQKKILKNFTLRCKTNNNLLNHTGCYR